MYSIQLEDPIADEVSVLEHLAIDDESAHALMVLAADEWMLKCPSGFELYTVVRPGGLDIIAYGSVVASYTKHRVTGVFSVHGEFGFEIKTPS